MLRCIEDIDQGSLVARDSNAESLAVLVPQATAEIGQLAQGHRHEDGDELGVLEHERLRSATAEIREPLRLRVRLSEKLQGTVVGDHRVRGEPACEEVRVNPERRGGRALRHPRVETTAHVEEVPRRNVLLEHRPGGLRAALPCCLVRIPEFLEAEDRVLGEKVGGLHGCRRASLQAYIVPLSARLGKYRLPLCVHHGIDGAPTGS